MSRLNVNDSVETEWGQGTVTEHTDRSVTIKLDNGETINVVTGTPGYDRIKNISHTMTTADEHDKADKEFYHGKPWTHWGTK